MEIKLNLQYFLYYLLLINILTIIIFYGDKQKAIYKKYRTSEAKLHVLEILGGVFIVLPMIYIIRHKNRKTSYSILTYLIFIGWIILFIFVIKCT